MKFKSELGTQAFSLHNKGGHLRVWGSAVSGMFKTNKLYCEGDKMKMQKRNFAGGCKATFSWENHRTKVYRKATEEKKKSIPFHMQACLRNL